MALTVRGKQPTIKNVDVDGSRDELKEVAVFYPDRSDLTKILREPRCGRLRRKLEEEAILALSPVHFFELFNSKLDMIESELALLNDFKGKVLWLSSPIEIWQNEVKARLQNDSLFYPYRYADTPQMAMGTFIYEYHEFFLIMKLLLVADRAIRVLHPPDESAGVRGELSDEEFLDTVLEELETLEKVSFADLADPNAVVDGIVGPTMRGLPASFSGIRSYMLQTGNLVMQQLPKQLSESGQGPDVEVANAALSGLMQNPRLKAKVLDVLRNLGCEAVFPFKELDGRAWFIVGPLMGRAMAVGVEELDLFGMAPEEFLAEAKRRGLSPREVMRSLDLSHTSAGLRLAVARERDRDSNRQMKSGDYGDILHLCYLPFVSLMTVDKGTRALLGQVSRRKKDDWHSNLFERTRPCGTKSLVNLGEQPGLFPSKDTSRP